MKHKNENFLSGHCNICKSTCLRFEGMMWFSFNPTYEYITVLAPIDRQIEIFVYVENNDFENTNFRDHILEQFSSEFNPQSGYIRPAKYRIYIAGSFRCLSCGAFSPMKNICPNCGNPDAYSGLGDKQSGYKPYFGITSEFRPRFWKKGSKEVCICGHRKE